MPGQLAVSVRILLLVLFAGLLDASHAPPSKTTHKPTPAPTPKPKPTPAPTPPPITFIRYLVDLNTYPLATCLDGSPAAYYIRQPHPLDQTTKFRIFFKGGAWCVSDNDCYSRSKGSEGSSKSYPPTTELGSDGFLATDPKINPVIHDWISIYIMYCDGTAFTGHVVDPVNISTTQNVSYHGAWIRDAIISELASNHGLTLATDVAIGGCSSGGHTVYVNIDYLATLVGQFAPTAKVTALADAGFFLDHEKQNSGGEWYQYIRLLFQWGFVRWNAAAVLTPACLAAYPLEGWRCFFPQYLGDFIVTPTFFLNSRYDTAQLVEILGLPNVPWKNYTTDEESLAVTYSLDFNTALNSSGIWTTSRNGGFLTSCQNHCMGEGSSWTGYLAPPRTGGNLTTISHAYTMWLQGNLSGADSWWVVDPSLLPNQTWC